MLKIPAKLEAGLVADWLEASLFLDKDDTDYRSDAELLDLFHEAAVDDPEALLDAVVRRVRARAAALGGAYPFLRDPQGFRLLPNAEGRLPYLFMLFVSMNQAYRELSFAGGTASAPAEIFEDLTCTALALYVNAPVIRFGAARRAPVPGGFSRAIEYIATEIGEPIGQRDIEKQETGDDGLDVLACLSFNDQRPGSLLIFGQCAIGTDWKDKRSELDIALWNRHLDWHVPPVRFFAVPFHHDDGRVWRETSARAGILLDRVRIAKLLVAAQIQGALLARIRAWLRTRKRNCLRLAGADA